MSQSSNSRTISRIRYAVLVAGVICLAAGLWRGEALAILRRAIIICLGCIGIG